MNRTEQIRQRVIEAVANAVAMKGGAVDEIDGATALIGDKAVIDSISMVTMIVELEEVLDADFGQEVILAGEGDILGEQSPFRTIDLLVAHIEALLGQG